MKHGRPLRSPSQRKTPSQWLTRDSDLLSAAAPLTSTQSTSELVEIARGVAGDDEFTEETPLLELNSLELLGPPTDVLHKTR